MNRLRDLAFVAALLVASASACQNAPDASKGPAASDGSGSPVIGASLEPSAVVAEPTALTGFVQGPGDVFLLDATEGLDTLASYRATLTVAFDGTKSGAPSSSTTTTTYSFVRDPGQYLLTVDHPADEASFLPDWEAVADGARYTRLDDTCVASIPEATEAGADADEAGPRTSRPLDPASQLPGFVGADTVGTETVNGIATETANLTPASLGWSDDVKASGSVAIATDGGYLVRYDLVIEGGPDLLGEGVSGKLSRHYELSDIGTASVAIPAGCPSGLIQAPMPADGVVVEALPGILTLTSKASVVDTAKLYRDTSIAFGWHAAGTTTINGDLGALSFTADGLAITVVVTAADGGSRVEIVATRT